MTRRASAVWVPAWFGRARVRRFSRNSVADVMAHAQALVDAGEARVVCVYDNANPSVANYEVHRHVTRVHWSGT